MISTAINSRLAEPGEKLCRNGNTIFSAEICWSNAVKYPYFPSREEITWDKRQTTRNFKKIDEKNRFFSIFFKLSQAVSSDVKMVPKCFAILRAAPIASGHNHAGIIWKKISHQLFDLQKPIFLRWLLYPLKIAFYGAVQNLKAFSIW